LPSDSWARRRALDAMFPWIGTTHSLALKLAGRQAVVSSKDLTDFSKALGGKAMQLPETDELEGYVWQEGGRDAVETALSVFASARHRMEPLRAAYLRMRPMLDFDAVQRIVDAYERYKGEIGKIDFEDMLIQGRADQAPVSVVLADEVQDNSPLLWDVLNTWAQARDFVMAGDPYQAIYLFSGAQPGLFIDHPGDLRRLGDSHRLTSQSARAAQNVLRGAGYEEGEWLGTWDGVGEGTGSHGDEFYLARTARLLNDFTMGFEHMGIPYGYIRGGGPLETKAADAFRVYLRLRQRGGMDVGSLNFLAQQMTPSYLPPGEQKRIKTLDQSMLLDEQSVSERWGMPNLGKIPYALKHGEYLLRVHGREGPEPFVFGPHIRVGTIHSAKGREADIVHLITSWGTLPYQATLSQEGRAAEGCVAYVGVTRHRASLRLEYVSEGTPYEFNFR
jgi:superfamily I DNA/RNA helicase